MIAGAGTGKTSTIIGKAGYLIKRGLATPEEILLIAFNRDIVSEMDERVHSRLGTKLNVRTFHGLGLDIIAESEGAKQARALRNINNAMRYIALEDYQTDDYEVQVATTVEQAKKLGEAGFEHYDTIDERHLLSQKEDLTCRLTTCVKYR